MPSLKLQNVPSEIRDWFSSEQTALAVGDINDRFGLEGEKRTAVPKLLFFLEIKELGPENFRRELSEKLQIFDSNLIASLISDIKMKILEPIRTPLLSWGVDIAKISPSTESIKPFPFLRQKPAFIPRTVQPETQRREFRPSVPPPTKPTPPVLPKPVPPPPLPPLEEVIDLSTFERIRRPQKPEKKPSEVQPKANGNTIDLR